MHHLLREELDAATGNSEFVIAQNLDIRGFSDWSLKVDSAQTALYLKKLYAKLIDTYFPSASFLKPTGDGLLVIETIQEEGLADALTRCIVNAREIVGIFGTLCSEDVEPMINFPVPTEVGIGLARGSASRLGTQERTLDYSGHVLNLASRLMDLARPKGIVVDQGFGMPLVPTEISKEFEQQEVYLKGVSPNAPVTVDCWPPGIQIPAIHLKPLEEEQWEHDHMRTTRKVLDRSTSQYYRFELTSTPLSGTGVECEVSHAAVTPGKRKAKGRLNKFPIDVHLYEIAGSPVARIDQKALAKRLVLNGVGPSWDIEIRISYRVG